MLDDDTTSTTDNGPEPAPEGSPAPEAAPDTPPAAKKAPAKKAAAKKTAAKKTAAKKAPAKKAATKKAVAAADTELPIEAAVDAPVERCRRSGQDARRGTGQEGARQADRHPQDPGEEGRGSGPVETPVETPPRRRRGTGRGPPRRPPRRAAPPRPRCCSRRPRSPPPRPAVPARPPRSAPPRRPRPRRPPTTTPRAPTRRPRHASADTADEAPRGSGRQRSRSGGGRGQAGSTDEKPADEKPADEDGDVSDDDTQDASDDEGQDGSGDDNEQGGPRRRRRRGGRRRRKSGDSDGGNGANGSGDNERTESDDDSEDDDDDDQSGEGGSTGSRRRRRRRRAGDSDDQAGDDPANTVVRVRKPRSAEDEITAISGSTRLEAKKQRRRDGREAGRRRAPIVSEAEFLARRESVDRVMVIRQHEDLTQIAVLEDKVLVEHYVARESQTSLIGNVYVGRVQNVLPSMEAAFIDIGKGRNAVLYAGEVNWSALGHKDGQPRKIESVLSSGQSVLVQVTKDPIGHKGARLTSQVSLAGRFLVYVPDGTTSGISRKLPDTERGRLKTLLKEIVPDTAGVIVRTAAEGASEDELTRDVERLKARWEDIEKNAKSGTAPKLLYGEPDLTLKVVRDLFTEDFTKLVIQGDDAWDTVQGYVSHVAPDLEERLERYDGDGDAYSAYRIDEQIAKGLDRKVWLPSGGSLIIDRTEAMTVVDVNTGKFTGSGGNLEETVTKNNLEAAEEMVRQLRLRDIGGIIVVDFIDMVLESNRDLVLRRLVECLGRDRTRHQVAEVTSLGLVQMTRKRIGTGLLEAFSENCDHCQGRGIVVHDLPVEPRKGDDGDRRGGGRRNRGRGRGDEGGNGGGNDSGGGAPSPKDVAAKARAENAEQGDDQADDKGQDNGRDAAGSRPTSATAVAATDATTAATRVATTRRNEVAAIAATGAVTSVRTTPRPAEPGSQSRPAPADQQSTSSATTRRRAPAPRVRAHAVRPRDAVVRPGPRAADRDDEQSDQRRPREPRPSSPTRSRPRRRLPRRPARGPRRHPARVRSGAGGGRAAGRAHARARPPSPRHRPRHPRWSPGPVVAARAAPPARR